MWQPSYATGADLAGWLGLDTEPVQLDLATEAASRSIDQYCGRQFGQTDSHTRFYTPKWHRDRWWCDIDDLMDDEPVVESDGVPTAGYILTPRNAVAEGRPWTRIEFNRGVRVGEVAITAQWGWASIPNAVKLACLTQAARLYDRRNNVGGALTTEQVDDVRLSWATASQELDADVLAAIRPYKRFWGAV